jgi:hypothetical protein
MESLPARSDILVVSLLPLDQKSWTLGEIQWQFYFLSLLHTRTSFSIFNTYQKKKAGPLNKGILNRDVYPVTYSYSEHKETSPTTPAVLLRNSDDNLFA